MWIFTLKTGGFEKKNILTLVFFFNSVFFKKNMFFSKKKQNMFFFKKTLDEALECSAAHHYWSMLHPLQLARDLATVVDSTVFTAKQEGLRSLLLTDLLQGIQGAVSLDFDHLEDVCSRSLTKAIQAKVCIRELMLGAIKPHILQDPLLYSELIHPEIFPPSALEQALPVFNTLTTYWYIFVVCTTWYIGNGRVGIYMAQLKYFTNFYKLYF